MTDPTLKAIVDWLSRGGAAAIAYFILTKVQAKWPALKEDLMFWATCAVTALIGFGVWHFGMWMGYINTPGPTQQEWVEAGLTFLIIIFSGSTVIYNLYQQRLKRVNPEAYAARYPQKDSAVLHKAYDDCVNPKEPRTLADVAWRGRGGDKA